MCIRDRKRTLRPSSSIRRPMRSGFCVTGFQIATFDTSIGISFVTMPPGWFFIGFGFSCFLTWLTPFTITCRSSTIFATSPRLPLSRPAMTTTLSPFLILRMGFSCDRPLVFGLQHFGRERHDLHEPLIAQFARDGSEDARADRLELGVEPVSYTHLRAHETDSYLVCRLLLE